MLLKTVKSQITGALILLSSTSMFAQLPVDGFYPKKNTVAAALSYNYKTYDDYYVGNSLAGGTPAGFIQTDLPFSEEGVDPVPGNIDDPSNQQSLGEVSAQIISIYAQYGITDRLSITATLPYISIKSEDNINDRAQLASTVDGLQDIGLFVKCLISDKIFKDSSKFSLGGAIGITFPLGDYDGGGVLSLGNEATS